MQYQQAILTLAIEKIFLACKLKYAAAAAAEQLDDSISSVVVFLF